MPSLVANKTVSEIPSIQSAKQNPENGNGLGELFVTPAITIKAPITAKLLTSHSAILPNKLEKKEEIEHEPATCVQHQGNLLENHQTLNVLLCLFLWKLISIFLPGSN